MLSTVENPSFTPTRLVSTSDDRDISDLQSFKNMNLFSTSLMPSEFVKNYMRHLHSSVLMADALLKAADVLSLESVPPSVPSSVPFSVPSSVPSSDTSSGPSPSFGPFFPFFFLLLPLPRPLPLFRFLPFPFPPAFASSVAHSVAPSPISVSKSQCKTILALHRKEITGENTDFWFVNQGFCLTSDDFYIPLRK